MPITIELLSTIDFRLFLKSRAELLYTHPNNHRTVLFSVTFSVLIMDINARMFLIITILYSSPVN
jgi:hypothetical protein